MKNVVNGLVSKLLLGLFLGLLLAGPVFGNEAPPTDGAVSAPQVEEKKVESKIEKKGKRRHHKNKKAVAAKVEKEAVPAAAPETKPQEVSSESK